MAHLQEEEAKDIPFASLPTELLVEIFSYLGMSDVYGRISPVCRRFKEVICSNPGGVWREFTLGSETTTQAIRWIQSCPALKRLALYFATSDFDTIVTTALRECRGLRSLHLNIDTKIGPAVLQAIGEVGGASLRKIRLYPNIFAAGAFKENVACLRHVTHFQLGDLPYWSRESEFPPVFGDEEIIAVADHCHQVQEFTWRHLPSRECYTMTSHGVNYFLERTRGTIRTFAVPPECLDRKSFEWIAKCHLLETWYNLEWQKSAVLSLDRLKKIKVLGIAYDKHEEGSFNIMFNNGGLNNLTHLKLDYIGDLSSLDMQAIGRHCPELTWFYFWCLTSNYLEIKFGLKGILQECAKLRTMNIRGTVNIITKDLFDNAVAPLRELKFDEVREVKEERMKELREISSMMPNLDIICCDGGRLIVFVSGASKILKWVGRTGKGKAIYEQESEKASLSKYRIITA